MLKPIALPTALLLVLIAAVWSQAAEPSKGALLKNPDLHALLDEGVVLDFSSADKLTVGSAALLRNGPAYSLWRTIGGTGGADQGTWRIEGDALCIRWKLLTSGTETCVQYFRLGDGQIESRRATDGVLRNMVRVRKS